MVENEQDFDADEAENALSDEELDALRDVGNEDGAQHDVGSDRDGSGHRLFDFRDPTRVLNGRMPGLEGAFLRPKRAPETSVQFQTWTSRLRRRSSLANQTI